MRPSRTGVLCGVAALVLVATGCERTSNAPPPAPTEPALAMLDDAEAPAPDAAPDLPAARTDAAFDAAYSGEAERPEVPEDVPTYAPATPVSSMSSPTRGTIVHLRTADAVERVADWYAAEFPESGWRIEAQNGVANSELITAFKGDRKATVLITGAPDGTQVLLTVLEQ